MSTGVVEKPSSLYLHMEFGHVNNMYDIDTCIERSFDYVATWGCFAAADFIIGAFSYETGRYYMP